MTEKKRRRHETLIAAVRKEPFLTDEALAKRLGVGPSWASRNCAPVSVRSRKMHAKRCVPFRTQR